MYKLIREKRKSITLSIDDTFQVIVKAPTYVSQKTIDEVVAKHQEWIRKTLETKAYIKQNSWFNQKKILYLGQYREICMIYKAIGKNKIQYRENKFYIYSKDLDEISIKKQMYNFIHQKANDLLTELSNKYCELLGYTYLKITIRNQKTRWGSCSSKGNLSYNIKIMAAPLDKIEYIILHEVMHLKHFNHSMQFWQAIEELMPDYKDKVAYFKKYGQYLTI